MINEEHRLRVSETEDSSWSQEGGNNRRLEKIA
jgi:hypothetical protein